jgi:hypothetical protein
LILRALCGTLAIHSGVFWLNGTRIISSERTVFVEGTRISIEGHGNTFNLKVRNVREWDDGQYACQVPGAQPIMQTSRITVKSK